MKYLGFNTKKTSCDHVWVLRRFLGLKLCPPGCGISSASISEPLLDVSCDSYSPDPVALPFAFYDSFFAPLRSAMLAPFPPVSCASFSNTSFSNTSFCNPAFLRFISVTTNYQRRHVTSKRIEIFGAFLTELAELDEPDRVFYIFWWEQTIVPQHFLFWLQTYVDQPTMLIMKIPLIVSPENYPTS